MEAYKPETQGETMDEGLRELVHQLSEATGEYLPVEYVDGTYEIEADSFTLSFTINDEQFEIRNIDTHGNSGLGRLLITAIHDFADENDLSVYASNVRDTAQGFWHEMGYQEGGEADEFFRAA
jgi:hypothetical protein